MALPSRILIIRPSALGDVCRSVPLAAALKQYLPTCEIHWLVNKAYADVLHPHPAIDSVIEFDRKGMGRSNKKLNPLPALAFLGGLKNKRYDTVIDAQGLARSGIFTWATRAERRIGHRSAKEFAWLGYNHRIRSQPNRHAVDWMLDLLGPLKLYAENPDLRLYADESALIQVKNDTDLQEPYIVIAPTSLWPGKRWPIERFTELTSRLVSQGNRAVVVGAPGEENQCQPLLDLAEKNHSVVNRVGSTSIAELMAIIHRAKLVIANDSAALHMAVGFDCPIVALFGPTHTHLVGPYGRKDSVLQDILPDDLMDHKSDTSGLAMMKRISVQQVHAATEKALLKAQHLS